MAEIRNYTMNFGPQHPAAHGVLRAFTDTNPLLDDYRAAVRAVNDGAEPRLYPGSPRFLAQLLRPQDVLILNEKHPLDRPRQGVP